MNQAARKARKPTTTIDSAGGFASEPVPPFHAALTDPLATLDFHASTPLSEVVS